MGLKIPKVMIAAVKSGSGKTTITCAFLKQLLCRKKHPVSFKCGPDYIDPMFHEQVLKIPSKNLDTFFSDASQIQALYEMELPGHDIAVLEGDFTMDLAESGRRDLPTIWPRRWMSRLFW